MKKRTEKIGIFLASLNLKFESKTNFSLSFCDKSHFVTRKNLLFVCLFICESVKCEFFFYRKGNEADLQYFTVDLEHEDR
jgi:hypothetical protein